MKVKPTIIWVVLTLGCAYYLKENFGNPVLILVLLAYSLLGGAGIGLLARHLLGGRRHYLLPGGLALSVLVGAACSYFALGTWTLPTVMYGGLSGISGWFTYFVIFGGKRRS